MFDMIGNIFKNLTSKPATRQYPFERRAAFKDTRGHIGIDIDKCIFCGICSKKCPPGALVVNRAEKSWEIDPYKCIICNECEEVCPKKCIINYETHNTSVLKQEKRKFIQQPKPPKEDVQDGAAPEAKVMKAPAAENVQKAKEAAAADPANKEGNKEA